MPAQTLGTIHLRGAIRGEIGSYFREARDLEAIRPEHMYDLVTRPNE
jgi:hypothetical protein